MKYVLLACSLFLASCQSGNIKMTDKYEDKAFVEVPSHIEALKVNGRTVPGSMLLGSGKTIEIPVGRTELVYRFYRMYDTQHGDDYEKVFSDKMTAVFVSEKNNHYQLNSLNPDSPDAARAALKKMKGYVLHKESGTKIDAIQGVIDDRFHGIKIMKPYDELKHWWKKSTQKEKDDFLKWIKDQ
ncbi:MAG: DUF2057 family protein [Lentisphaeraceae bacterium]|nr:DUF2057 family protein [Lentisphaeraceae bacterium]